MSEQVFSLTSFPSDLQLPKITIGGRIVRHSNNLSIEYKLLGPLAGLMLPPLTDKPARKNGLWEETCFEFFLGEKGSEHYREFNLSPSGHWNVYRFTSYREGMTEDPVFTSLPFDTVVRQGSLTLSLGLDPDKIIPAGKALEVGVSAVVKTKNGEFSHWALVHTGPQPDFHRRDAFILDL
jgi:hypothetical protein